jgi:ferrous iron transport protein A
MGDPVEIQVRGFALTLRKDEAAALLVEREVGHE